MDFSHIEARLAHPRVDLPENEYEHLVKLTANLLGKKYIVVHGLVKDWSIQKIRDRFHEAQNHSGNVPPDVYWWWKRKQDKLSTVDKPK